MNTSRNAARATKTYWKRFRASQFGHISHYWITRESKSLIRIDRPAICFRIRQIKSRSASLDWNRICACRLGSLFVQLQKLKDHMAPHPTANLTFLKQLWALIGQWCLKQRSRFSSPSHEPEPDSRGVTSQELETSELEQIQSAHTEWLASNGKSGQRADLRNRIVPTEWLGNLSKADLRGACILPRRYADNVNALFEGANLRDATIKESHLGKSFIGTDLSRATWTGACLCNADLSEAVLVELARTLLALICPVQTLKMHACVMLTSKIRMAYWLLRCAAPTSVTRSCLLPLPHSMLLRPLRHRLRIEPRYSFFSSRPVPTLG